MYGNQSNRQDKARTNIIWEVTTLGNRR